MKQKIIFLSIVASKFIREIIYILLGATLFGIITDGPSDSIDQTKNTAFILLIIGIIILILISYLLPYFFKKKWPSITMQAEEYINKPHKVFLKIGIAFIILAIIIFSVFMYSMGVL